MQQLKVVYRNPASLKPDPENPVIHDQADVEKLGEILLAFGFDQPIVVDEHGTIIKGHKRTRAAILKGIASVPCVVRAGLSRVERIALRASDNRTAQDARWNEGVLLPQLDELKAANFDMKLSGFNADELFSLGVAAAAAGGAEDDEAGESKVHEIPTGPVEDSFWVSVRGPLVQQAAALQQLQKVMAEIPDVTVELGTTPRDGSF